MKMLLLAIGFGWEEVALKSFWTEKKKGKKGRITSGNTVAAYNYHWLGVVLGSYTALYSWGFILLLNKYLTKEKWVLGYSGEYLSNY